MTSQRPAVDPTGGPHPATVPSWHRRAGLSLILLIVGVCLTAIVVIWLITLQRIGAEHDQAVDAARQSNANLAIASEQQVFRTLKGAEQVAAFVREQYLQQGTDIDLRQWVQRGVIRDAMFNIVSVVDENGAVVSSSQPSGPVSYADREFFRVHRDGGADTLYVSPPVMGRVSGRWQVPMSLRITRPGGSFGGVVVMSVDPASFAAFYRQADLGDQGLLELSGLDGVVRIRRTGHRADFGMDGRGSAWFQARGAAAEGDLVDDGQALDGVRRIVSYRSMAGYPLMVAVGTAEAEVLAPVQQRRAGYLVVAASATLAMVVFAGLLATLVVRQRLVSRALQASESVFRATFHQAAMGIAHISPDGRILGANDKFCRMLGYNSRELMSRTVFDLSDDEDRDAARQFLAHRLSGHAQVFSPEIEKPYRRRDGSLLWVCEALGVVKDAQGRPDFLVAVVQDVTARKELEARLSHDALHDALTGLPNRVMFQDRLDRVLESARRHHRGAGVLYVDLDGFKDVNDSRGHAAGDALLREVAHRLQACVRAEDTVARIGGDEFGIVLAVAMREHDCEVVAHKVLDALAMPFDLDGGPAQISGSVGGALFPLHGHDAAALLAHADGAMYSAKNAGKNRFSWEPSTSGEATR